MLQTSTVAVRLYQDSQVCGAKCVAFDGSVLFLVWGVVVGGEGIIFLVSEIIASFITWSLLPKTQ